MTRTDIEEKPMTRTEVPEYARFEIDGIERVSPDRITALDQRSEMDDNPRVKWDCVLFGVTAPNGIVSFGSAIFDPATGRAGIATNGDSDWTDATSIEDALDRWAKGEMIE